MTLERIVNKFGETSDMAKWSMFLSSFNIPHQIEFKGDPISAGSRITARDTTISIVQKSDCKTISGYSGFETIVEFEDNGQFKLIGAWE